MCILVAGSTWSLLRRSFRGVCPSSFYGVDGLFLVYTLVQRAPTCTAAIQSPGVRPPFLLSKRTDDPAHLRGDRLDQFLMCPGCYVVCTGSHHVTRLWSGIHGCACIDPGICKVWGLSAASPDLFLALDVRPAHGGPDAHHAELLMKFLMLHHLYRAVKHLMFELVVPVRTCVPIPLDRPNPVLRGPSRTIHFAYT